MARIEATPPHRARPGLTLSLVIPAHDEAGQIGACLAAVFAHAPGSFDEIVVVDNASTDATASIARSFPGVVVAHEPRKGLGHARQRGYEATTGDILAYIDADTRLPRGWAEAVRACFAEHPDAVSLSGPARYFDATPAQRLALNAGWWLGAPLAYRLIGYMIYGGHFAVRRKALDAIGGFDPAIAFYGEDTMLARRLAAQGRTLFRMDFVIDASARRFQAEGLLRTALTYALNYIWPALFGRAFHRRHRDIRIPNMIRSEQSEER